MSQHENTPPEPIGSPPTNEQLEAQKQQGAEFGIAYDGHRYQYRQYCYDDFINALNYAKLDHSRLTFRPIDTNPPSWLPAWQPTAAERASMAELSITYQHGIFHFGDYRYTRLTDACDYARLKR